MQKVLSKGLKEEAILSVCLGGVFQAESTATVSGEVARGWCGLWREGTAESRR